MSKPTKPHKKMLRRELEVKIEKKSIKMNLSLLFEKKCNFVKENVTHMNDEIIISGLTLAQIKSKAQYILETEVIPKAELFEIRKREGRLSKEVKDILKKQNA